MANHSMEITLRPFRLSDADDFLIYAGDENVTRFTRLNTFTSKQEAISYIQNRCHRTGEEDGCRAEVGYALARDYWGKGIATRAVKLAISDGFKQFPDLLRIEAHVEVDNKPSQRVLEKLGFQKEALLGKFTYNKGALRDLFLYSLLSTDFIL
ncbi:hypothetical protein FEM48_Zijuj07G0123400 [Ziziphus jujuba var. spinosa]|uniref:N-acetyltransferase domain-containing protein n=1 Tax=Ziziphus jujuba var. spinosa TaxID=714518 RepID=A0A978V4L4_ZIZJJ|nr:hypothetical protein FEM48_Zijuj07G0123400 [Ziziphus jujuba var. spinosa]